MIEWMVWAKFANIAAARKTADDKFGTFPVKGIDLGESVKL